MRDFYQDILDIISAGGEAACVIPIGDPGHENAARTTVTTKGVGVLDGLVFTYSEAITSFDAPIIYARNEFRTPDVPFNNSDEEADSPDAAAWSRDDGSSEGLSVGGRVTPAAINDQMGILGKESSGAREWSWFLTSNGTYRLRVRDPSAGVQCQRTADVAIVANVPHSITITYDGSGGASAADGIVMYQDGASFASTANNNASYVAMETPGGVVELGFVLSANHMNGRLSTLFFTHRVLSAAEVLNLDDVYTAMQRETPSRVYART